MLKKSETARPQIAFLLTQLGTDGAMKFASSLAPTGLTPPEAGILRLVGQTLGISQQELARKLQMHASRLVAVIDGLESRGLVERKASENDRRTWSLQLGAGGREALAAIGRIAQEHEERICEGLSKAERGQLVALLNKLAAHRGLVPGVHPGYRNLGVSRDCEDKPKD